MISVPNRSGPSGQPRAPVEDAASNTASDTAGNTIGPAARDGASAAPPQRRFTAGNIFFGSAGLRAFWGILLFLLLRSLLLVYGASPLVGMLFPWASGTVSFSRPGRVLVTEGMALLSLVVATWLMGKIERRPTSVYGLGGAHRLRNCLAGFAWGLALLALLVFALRATGLLVFDARLLSGAHALRYGAVWLVGFLLVGLSEEYFFRGYLQFTLARGIDGIYDWLRARYSYTQDARTRDTSSTGFCIAALLLSFGFGFMHLSNAGESSLGLLAAALIALVFCLSLWRTGSLWWAIGFHAAWDWAQSFLFGVADSGIAIQGHLFASHPVGRPLLSGGLTGPAGSLFVLPVVALAAVIIVLTLPIVPREAPLATARATSLD